MIDKKYIELMNREIDELISPDEKQHLHNYLSENPEAREYYDGLLSATQALDRLPEPVISDNLNKRIVNLIDFTRYKDNPDKRAAKFIPRFIIKYAFTFAAGLLAGIVIYALFSTTSMNLSQNDISGTIGIEEAVILREVPINAGDIQGKIALSEKNNLYLIEINLNSVSPVDLLISYPDQVKLDNFKPGIPGIINLITAGNFIKAENSGPQQYTFSFTNTGTKHSPVHIELAHSGKKVFEYEFALNR